MNLVFYDETKPYLTDIWHYWEKDPECFICIPTNVQVKKNGELVMGAGLAKEAARRFPDCPAFFGKQVGLHYANPIYDFVNRLIAFPTKYDWHKPSNLNLIRETCEHLSYFNLSPARLKVTDWDKRVGEPFRTVGQIYLPPVGCGLGGLDLKEVVELCSSYLVDRFTMLIPTRTEAQYKDNAK